MRVLVLFSSSQLGGAERSLSRMAFAANEVSYQLATLDSEGPWCDWVRSHGVQPLVLGNVSSDGAGLRLSAFWRLLKHIRNKPVDVIYVCGTRASLVLRFVRILLPGIKLVHGVRWNPDSNSRMDRFFRMMERLTHPLIDVWITNSAIARQTLVRRCWISPDRILVVYNGLESFPGNLASLNENPMVVLTVANLIPRKGHLEYLAVICEVLKVIPANVQFVFVGRDDMNGEVCCAVENSGFSEFVRYEGFQEDVSGYFRRAKVCVLPSLRDEGCPTSLLESFSWGVPVIAYDIDGMSELIDDGVDGFLIPPGDSDLFADRIITLLEHTEIAKSFGYAGKNKVMQRFSLAQCVTSHAKIFFNLKGYD